MTKICIFGDSVGKGVVLDESSGRYGPIDLMAIEPLCSVKAEVINLSMFGATVTKALSLLDRYTEELTGSDFAILEYGGNDCNFMWNEIAVAPDAAHVCKTPPEIFVQTYKTLIERVRAAGVKPVMTTIPPLHAGRFFRWVSRGIDADAILRWLGGEDMIYRWQEFYSTMVTRISRECDVPLIDVRGAFLQRQDFHSLVGGDGMHPTRAGHELIVATVCGGMGNIIHNS